MMFWIYFCNALQSSGSLDREFQSTGCRNFFFNILAYVRFLVHFGGQIQTSCDKDSYLQKYSSATKALRRMLAETVVKLHKIEAKKTRKFILEGNYLSSFAFWLLTWSRQSEITKT